MKDPLRNQRAWLCVPANLMNIVNPAQSIKENVVKINQNFIFQGFALKLISTNIKPTSAIKVEIIGTTNTILSKG